MRRFHEVLCKSSTAHLSLLLICFSQNSEKTSPATAHCHNWNETKTLKNSELKIQKEIPSSEIAGVCRHHVCMSFVLNFFSFSLMIFLKFLLIFLFTFFPSLNSRGLLCLFRKYKRFVCLQNTHFWVYTHEARFYFSRVEFFACSSKCTER